MVNPCGVPKPISEQRLRGSVIRTMLSPYDSPKPVSADRARLCREHALAPWVLGHSEGASTCGSRRDTLPPRSVRLVHDKSFSTAAAAACSFRSSPFIQPASGSPTARVWPGQVKWNGAFGETGWAIAPRVGSRISFVAACRTELHIPVVLLRTRYTTAASRSATPLRASCARHGRGVTVRSGRLMGARRGAETNGAIPCRRSQKGNLAQLGRTSGKAAPVPREATWKRRGHRCRVAECAVQRCRAMARRSGGRGRYVRDRHPTWANLWTWGPEYPGRRAYPRPFQ